MKKTVLLHQPLPSSTAAETPLQSLIWCFSSYFSKVVCFYPEEWFFTDAGSSNNRLIYLIICFCSTAWLKKQSFSASCRPAIQQQKLLSSPWFGVLQVNTPKGVLIRGVFFSQTPVLRRLVSCRVASYRVGISQSVTLWRVDMVCYVRVWYVSM